MSKVAIYTIVTNDYDTVKPITIKNIPHYLFTDNPNIVAPGYTIIPIDKTDNQRLQRKLKILIPEELNDYDTVVYVDASITLTGYFVNYLRTYKGGLMIAKHPNRNCVYEEGLAVKRLEKAEPSLVNKQIAEYYENDFPLSFGMWATGFMVRDKSTRAMCEIWYEKLSHHTHRDQLSLPWAIKESGIKPTEVPLSKICVVAPHKKKEPPKVFYSTPFRVDKNIGRANNEFIAMLPDDSWVCITDGDALWLRPDWGKCVSEVINNLDPKFGLIGCLTNRLGGLHQCYKGKFSTDNDVANHYDIANEVWEQYGSSVQETTGIAGLCMIFHKSIWKRVGGFKENIFTADSEFNKDVKRLGLKIGIAKGLYMFHSYRIWEKEHKKAWQSVNHLK